MVNIAQFESSNLLLSVLKNKKREYFFICLFSLGLLLTSYRLKQEFEKYMWFFLEPVIKCNAEIIDIVLDNKHRYPTTILVVKYNIKQNLIINRINYYYIDYNSKEKYIPIWIREGNSKDIIIKNTIYTILINIIFIIGISFIVFYNIKKVVKRNI